MAGFDIASFQRQLLARLPGILTQLDRDEDSPTFGSFDRNFWHYKIRDFSSMILQQGMLITHTLYKNWFRDNVLYQNPVVLDWVNGALQFWASQQLRSGAFNEYYPWESGYPPTAFSLYAVGLVARDRNYVMDDEQVKKAIQKAAGWLMAHREVQAYNQEAAGLAGMFLCKSIPGIRIDEVKLHQRLNLLLAGQSPEGWFPEYGGPDTGYLSVTIDCLWDIFEITGNKQVLEAMEKATEYIASMISVSGHTPVMINARNTDYIVPYGLTRLGNSNPLAAKIVTTLFGNVSNPDHFLHRTDDRYACHYVYQSCFRSLPYLEKLAVGEVVLPHETAGQTNWKEAGIWIQHDPEKRSVYVYAKKGGIVNVFDSKGIRGVDYGWRARLGKGKVAVTHWLDGHYTVEMHEQDLLVVKGKMSKHGWMKSSPLRHIFLRMASFVFGYRLMARLRKVMIFAGSPVDVEFERKVLVKEDRVLIEDTFTGAGLKGLELYRAPHYSLRHVASAGNFVPEEMIPVAEDRFKLTDNQQNMVLSREI
jgi:hypothetical protein